MKQLTIVIPSYNTADFIDKNMSYYLDEVLFEDVEILLIDDGSKDNTKDKANEYHNRYPDYVSVISKENGGHGSVINCAIKKAKGKYFKVIDADDWVETKNLINFIPFLKGQDADLIVNPYYKIDETTGKRWKVNVTKKRKMEIGRNYQFDDAINNHIKFLCLHNFTIRTDILRENDILMTEKCFYDDFQYVLFPVPYINTVSFFYQPIYCYLIGQMNQSVSDNNVLKNKDMIVKIYADSVGYFKNCNRPLSAAKTKYIHDSIIGLGKTIYNIFLRNYKEPKSYYMMKEYDTKLCNISKDYYDELYKKYFYLDFIRRGNRIIFYFCAIVLYVYKKLKK